MNDILSLLKDAFLAIKDATEKNNAAARAAAAGKFRALADAIDALPDEIADVEARAVARFVEAHAAPAAVPGSPTATVAGPVTFIAPSDPGPFTDS